MQKLLKCLYRDFETLNQARLVFDGEVPGRGPDQQGAAPAELPRMAFMKEYTVKPGDSLWKIVEDKLKDLQKQSKGLASGKNFPKITTDLIKTRIVNLMSENKLKTVNIQPGQKLKFPGNVNSGMATLKDLVEKHYAAKGKEKTSPSAILEASIAAKRKEALARIRQEEAADQLQEEAAQIKGKRIASIKRELQGQFELDNEAVYAGFKIHMVSPSGDSYNCPETQLAQATLHQVVESIYAKLSPELQAKIPTGDERIFKPTAGAEAVARAAAGVGRRGGEEEPTGNPDQFAAR